MKSRIFIVLLAVVLVIGLAACTPAPTTPAEPASPSTPTTPTTPATPSGPERITEFAVTMAAPPETIDPQKNSSVDGAIYEVHLGEGLMKYKWDGTGVEPGLAESYTVSPDGLVWTFTLRADAKWSDGQPVTANDFVYTWKRLVDPQTISPYGLDMGVFIKNGGPIASDTGMSVDELGVKALDERTFEVTLEGPCAYFDEVAAFPSFYPVRQDVVEAHGDRWATSPDTYISAGPFKMESFNIDAYLTVVPNEYYYNRDAIVPTKLTFQFLADEVAMVNAVQSGEVAFSRLIPTEERASLKAKGLYQILPQLGTYYVCFQNKVAPYDNVNVRKALSLAIDRTYITDVLLEGAYAPATAFVGTGFQDVNGEFYQEGKYFSLDYEANKEMARQALAEAGYPDGANFPKVEYMTNPTTLHLNIAEALQAMWKDVLNIDVEIVQQEWNVFLATRRNGEYQISRHGWIADFNDPLNLLNIFLSSGGNNDAKYVDAEYDRLLDVSVRSSDRAERMQAMHDAEDILIGRDWAVAPLMYYVVECAADPALKDWGFTPLAYMFFQTAYLEK